MQSRKISPLLLALASALPAVANQIPNPLEWEAPQGAPVPVPAWSSEVFSEAAASPDSPVISEWHRTVKPGETLVMTGARFTTLAGEEAGIDTMVWLVTSTGQFSIKPTVAEENMLLVTLPDDLPFDVFLIAVQNQKGVGAPVAVNRATPEWIGPLGNSGVAGDKKRVFGRNLSKDRGEKDSYVFLQPANGGAFTQAKVTSVEPYAVEFEIPGGLQPGSHTVFVHNGHGGQYGLGQGPELIVEAARWMRGDQEIILQPSGSDDTEAFKSAIETLSGNPNGGTIRLEKGTYILTRPITITDHVRIVGAGREATLIEVHLEKKVHSIILLLGSRIALEDFSLHLKDTGFEPQFSLLGSDWQKGGTDDLLIRNLAWSGDPTIRSGGIGFFGSRIEVTGVDAERSITIHGEGLWIHNNDLWGAPYGGVGAEAAMMGAPDRSVIERNHIETRNWPAGPDGDFKYRQSMEKEQLLNTIWSKRVYTGHAMTHTYFAHNTTKHVATQDNKGEMLLFHETGAHWMGKVKSADGLEIVLDEDGTINGVQREVLHGDTRVLPLGGPLKDLKVEDPGFFGYDSHLLVVRGPGFGQSRRIVAQSGNTLTLNQPWRVEPDATSLVVVTPLYFQNILYRNELNAFPEGYVIESHTASNGIQYDGNGWMNSAEGNISRRTSSGRRIGGRNRHPNFWNEFRDEIVEKALFSSGIMIMTGGNIISPSSFANAFRGMKVEMVHPKSPISDCWAWFPNRKEPSGTPEMPMPLNLLNIIEGTVGSSPRLGLLEGEARTHGLEEGHGVINRNFYHNNTYTITGDDPKPLSLSVFSKPILEENKFVSPKGKELDLSDTTPVRNR